jgi:CRISPR/Cas system-associated exonuclease Cas4 (RecB family)
MTLALILLAFGILLLFVGRAIRHRHGLLDARTISVEGQNLYDPIHGLSGRPDHVIEEDDLPIPEEWKTKAQRAYDNHVAQLGTYFILIEAVAKRRPTHGYVVTKGGQRHRVENSPELREWVLQLAEQIRAEKRALRAAGLLRNWYVTWPKSAR